MGKGDIRTRRGKIFRGTYGTTRLKKKRKKKAAEAAKTGKVEGQ
ncbi:MAG: 30S ribosomal protein THX [Gemmatimonadetes bacterium]|nr:MAG: 30S ribosomal protein THX [Gemmatimonadota bacterium]